MRPFSRIAVALSFVGATALADQPKLSETVNVHLVEVPVTVVARDGNPIRGLTKSDFEIFDQGKAREIATFDRVDFASSESLQKMSPLNPEYPHHSPNSWRPPGPCQTAFWLG